jgi:predicted deacylase
MATRITEWVIVETPSLHLKHSFDFVVVRLDDRSWLTIPVEVAVGDRPRPRLVAFTGIHGDEPEGMLALLDFWESCDPGKLHGTVILVPVADPTASAGHQRRSPLNGFDLNRVFPRKVDGTPSERLVYRLLNEIIAGSDLIFTLHSWYATGTVAPYIEVPGRKEPATSRSLEAAKAAGFRRIREGGWPEGILARAANALGIPVVEVEIGGTACPSRKTAPHTWIT